MDPTHRRDMVWQKIIGLHFDFSYLWNSHNKLTIIHIHGLYTHRIRLLLCYQLCVCECAHCTTYFNPHFYPGHLCVCGNDGDIAMAVCNGLFFITFPSPSPFLSHPWLHVIRFVTMRIVFGMFGLVWFKLIFSPSPPHERFFTKFMSGDIISARPLLCFL